MNNYNVLGGGFYRYIKNTRTGKGSWLRTDSRPLKRTETDKFSYEEAQGIIKLNESSYIKMVNVTIVEA